MAEESVSSFAAFADAYRAAKSLDVAQQLDPQSGTALVFADICADRARLAQDGAPPAAPLDDVHAEEWDTEQHTWRLIQLLFSYVFLTYPVNASSRAPSAASPSTRTRRRSRLCSGFSPPTRSSPSSRSSASGSRIYCPSCTP